MVWTVILMQTFQYYRLMDSYLSKVFNQKVWLCDGPSKSCCKK